MMRSYAPQPIVSAKQLSLAWLIFFAKNSTNFRSGVLVQCRMQYNANLTIFKEVKILVLHSCLKVILLLCFDKGSPYLLSLRLC